MRTLSVLLVLVSLGSPANALVEFVLPNPTVFDVGETVTFSLVNNTASEIALLSAPIWWHISRYPDGPLVDGCFGGIPKVTFLSPGEWEAGSWDQMVCHGPEAAGPGMYRLWADYSVGMEILQVQRLFCIGGDCAFPPTGADEPFESMTWGRAKARYQ